MEDCWPKKMVDLEVIEHFALVHDVMRENENMDLHHGPRGGVCKIYCWIMD